MQLFINNWSSVLTLPATASAVQLSVDEAEAALLVGLGSGDHYLLTLATTDVNGTETAWEIVRVTGNTAGVLDVLRGQEGTTPLDLEAGAAISARLTKESMEALRDSGGGGAWGGITGTLADQTDLQAALDGKATAAQGAKADSAVQPGALAAVATSGSYAALSGKPTIPTAPGDIGAATAAQGAKADTAVQPAGLSVKEQVLTAGANVTIDRTDPVNPIISASVSGGGGGDVVGPASATNNEIALYDGTTGKLLKGGGVLGTAAAANTGDFAPSSHVGAGGAAHANAAAGGAAGFMTGADKTKLDGVATGATANANTDSLTEGSSNLYHTAARVRAVLLTGLSLASGAAVAATDTVLAAFGKLQKQIDDLVTSVSGKQATLVSGTNIKTVNGSSLLGSGDLAISGGASLPVVQTFTGNKTLALADINKWSRSLDATAQVVTVPAQATVAWTADAEIHIEQGAAGSVTITGAAGVSINGVTAGSFSLAGQYAAATLKRTGSDAWTLVGMLSALGSAGDWCTYGGTANAISLTPNGAPARAAYRSGDEYRFRATAANTGAATVNVAGLGVKNLVTVTGTALPSGYIRTDLHTIITYDATGDRFVVGRDIERGSNANGEYTKQADGTLNCWLRARGIAMTADTDATDTWTFPVAVADYTTALMQVTLRIGVTTNAYRMQKLEATTATNSTGTIRVRCDTTQSYQFSYSLIGRWY